MLPEGAFKDHISNQIEGGFFALKKLTRFRQRRSNSVVLELKFLKTVKYQNQIFKISKISLVKNHGLIF